MTKTSETCEAPIYLVGMDSSTALLWDTLYDITYALQRMGFSLAAEVQDEECNPVAVFSPERCEQVASYILRSVWDVNRTGREDTFAKQLAPLGLDFAVCFKSANWLMSRFLADESAIAMPLDEDQLSAVQNR